MNKIFCTAVLALIVPVAASAETLGACAPRRAIGAALGFLTADVPMDPELAGVGRFGLATTTGTGLEAAVNHTFPIANEWSITTEAGAGGMAVAQERDADGTYEFKKTGDSLTIQRLQVGLQHRRAGRFVCGYSSIAAGLYRYNYRGDTLRVPGIALSVGLEGARASSGTMFVELGVSVALSALRSPTAAELVGNLRPAIGWRFRF